MGQEPIVIQFNKCRVECWPSTGYLETIFEDGTKVHSFPQNTDTYKEQAVRLGYSHDIDLMSFEHEILHTFLAEKMGYPYSPTMWSVAHGNNKFLRRSEWPDITMGWEEEMALAFAEWMNTRQNTGDLHHFIGEVIRRTGMNLEDLEGEFCDLLTEIYISLIDKPLLRS